jgi:hypothetical protein
VTPEEYSRKCNSVVGLIEELRGSLEHLQDDLNALEEVDREYEIRSVIGDIGLVLQFMELAEEGLLFFDGEFPDIRLRSHGPRAELTIVK